MISQEERVERISKAFKTVPDFPTPGIAFLDIMPIFADPQLLSIAVDAFQHLLRDVEYDAIVGLQVRGFLFGTPLAYKLKKPFIAIRKKGKLPGQLINSEYQKEYGKDCIQLQKDSIKKGQKVVLIDDVLATGGTLGAAIKIVEQCDAQIAKIVLLADIPSLNGMKKLKIAEDKVSVLTHI